MKILIGFCMSSILSGALFAGPIPWREGMNPEEHWRQNQKACDDLAQKPDAELKENNVFIVYGEAEGPISGLVIFNGRDFTKADQRYIKNFKSYYDLRTGRKFSVDVRGQMNSYTEDCEWYAEKEGVTIQASDDKSTADLFASEVVKLDFGITSEAKTLFYSLNKDCVANDTVPPSCDKPDLIATSDLDEDGLLEFWYRDPYSWDWGFAVAEVSKGNDNLVTISKECFSCD